MESCLRSRIEPSSLDGLFDEGSEDGENAVVAPALDSDEVALEQVRSRHD